MSAAHPLPKKRRSKRGNSLAANCSGLSFACTWLILANSLYESLIERISNSSVLTIIQRLGVQGEGCFFFKACIGAMNRGHAKAGESPALQTLARNPNALR